MVNTSAARLVVNRLSSQALNRKPAEGRKEAHGEYAYLVQMDLPAELEDEFNRVYDTEHVPNIVKAHGVNGCVRYKVESTNKDGMARYAALYDIDSPEVPTSAGWPKESEKRDWATQIRPHATNRSHTIYKKIG